MITPTLILPHQGGGKFFRELDTPQLCCGVLHSTPLKRDGGYGIHELNSILSVIGIMDLSPSSTLVGEDGGEGE
jgi:hypothetical protein